MDTTTLRGGRPQPDLSPWGVPWPSGDDLQRDADTAWAVEAGLVDPGAFDFGAIGVGVSRAAVGDPGSLAGVCDASSQGVDALLPCNTVHASVVGSANSCCVAMDGSEAGAGVPPEPRVSTPEELLAELEREVRERHRATAAEYRLTRLLLERAAADPVPWVGPDPTLDLAWNDSRGRTVAAVRRDRRDLAERAAVAEIATRLRLSEQTVRTRAAHADVLQTRCPDVWEAFAEGSISERHAIESARLAGSLPEAEVVAAPVTAPDGPTPGAGKVAAAGDEGREGDGSPVAEEATPSFDSRADQPESWRAFDEGARDRALRLPPARFAVAARSLRERVHGESPEARHRRAARDRGVWLTAELDGMATLSALLPADRAHDAMARVDRAARHLRVGADEDRTLAQLRADVFAELLVVPPATAARRAAAGSASAEPDPAGAMPAAPIVSATVPGASVVTAATAPVATGPASLGPTAPGAPASPASTRSAAIVITVPALTLLGEGTEPAVLDGYGPIDLDTARRLAGEATSWVRVLTHPLTGVPLALDRTTYRVPTALRRWLGVLSPTCTFPGCGRSARECDLDHLTAWIDGGGTDDDNLAPECRHHHRLRHESRWHPSSDPDTGELRWKSPLGAEMAEDPPPF